MSTDITEHSSPAGTSSMELVTCEENGSTSPNIDNIYMDANDGRCSVVNITESRAVKPFAVDMIASTAAIATGGQEIITNVITPDVSDDDTLPDIYSFKATRHAPETSLNTNCDVIDTFLNLVEEQPDVRHHTIKLHRGHVFSELRTQFASGQFDIVFDCFTFEMVLPNGETENAEDNGGVVRDALVEFWESFYDQCTLGREHKVPFLRHDYKEEDWKAIAKVLFYGWKEQKYFPIHLSKAFMSCCIYGMDTSASSHDSLIKEFLSYIPLSEAKTISSALEGNFDKEELIEILDIHECRVAPT